MDLECSSIWLLFDGFLTVMRFGVMRFEGKDQRGTVPFSSHPVKGTCSQHDITVDINLDQLAWDSVCQIYYFFLPFNIILFEGRHCGVQPTLRSGGLCPAFLKME